QTKKPVPDPFITSPKKTEISGRIKNYVPGNNNRFIRFRTYDISGRTKDTTFFIDKTGSFTATFSQPFESDIAMMYDENFVTLYNSPGEKIIMDIDPVKLKSSEDKSKAITLSGKSAAISTLIMQFRLSGNEFLLPEENWEDSTLSDQVIAEARIKRMKKEIDSLEKWMKKKAVTNRTFANWAS